MHHGMSTRSIQRPLDAAEMTSPPDLGNHMSDPRRRKIPQRQLQPRLRCLYLSAKEMERALVKERMRCDRYRQWFSLIVIELLTSTRIHSGTRRLPSPKQSEPEQLLLLGKYLRRRLRLTDERGMLLKGGVGVMLPMTDAIGARTVLRDIVSSMHAEGIEIEANIFCYDPAPSHKDQRPLLDPEDSEQSEVDLDKDPEGHEATPRDELIDTTLSQSTIAADHLAYCAPSFPAWKRWIDIMGSACGIVIATPIVLGAGLAIKMTSRGPVFFRQVRAGQYGRPFAMYKLRTMVVNAEDLKSTLLELNERDGPAFKMKNDPRVTKLGYFLRKTGIDEIPQLWNVLKGDMSIVGPRPLPCHEDRDCKHWHRQRLDTKPGLTCIWQISKSRDVSFEEWMRMDLRYARSRTIRHDIALMFKTIGAVILGRVGH